MDCVFFSKEWMSAASFVRLTRLTGLIHLNITSYVMDLLWGLLLVTAFSKKGLWQRIVSGSVSSINPKNERLELPGLAGLVEYKYFILVDCYPLFAVFLINILHFFQVKFFSHKRRWLLRQAHYINLDPSLLYKGKVLLLSLYFLSLFLLAE